ncbi:type II toxin-antitoxin system RelE/ParE family toxin [Fulvivirga sp. M361]|uniref:type II toxin-antitoxin system RelE/ParE family toxin n=1 Tax=Fulvivirga sp. M361 TaxID=2594266 RepID=UPI00117A142E|nr:type II toxin-antitoxin system RelE/ParE family toxin [Fulvivirga sp. M361]TRX53021.1 type II toxin-antitoxin system RelE/ParE family toxin [Fulvivirga sp. M361]
MALEIFWTDEAKKDLDNIIEYLESRWTDREISKFFNRLEKCLAHIQKAPHRSKDSLRKPGTKEYQHSPQTTIFYSYDNDKINLLRLWANPKDSTEL